MSVPSGWGVKPNGEWCTCAERHFCLHPLPDDLREVRGEVGG